MSINFKRFLERDDTRVALLIVVVGCVSFVLGRFSVENRSVSIVPSERIESVSTAYSAVSAPAASVPAQEKTVPPLPAVQNGVGVTGAAIEGAYVASKSGTKYHLPWCSGAQRIKEENKVWFETKEEAEKAGYSPAANCKGI